MLCLFLKCFLILDKGSAFLRISKNSRIFFEKLFFERIINPICNVVIHYFFCFYWTYSF